VEASPFPFAASAQLFSWLVAMRGSTCLGIPTESCSDFGSNRELSP
jgi:hypothetical protein